MTGLVFWAIIVPAAFGAGFMTRRVVARLRYGLISRVRVIR